LAGVAEFLLMVHLSLPNPTADEADGKPT